MGIKLKDFDAVTFDVYGTLIDWEPSIIAFLREWSRRSRIAASDDALLMAFDRARAALQKERPAHLYPDILRKSFDHICAEFKAPVDPETRERFARAPSTWPPLPRPH